MPNKDRVGPTPTRPTQPNQTRTEPQPDPNPKCPSLASAREGLYPARVGPNQTPRANKGRIRGKREATPTGKSPSRPLWGGGALWVGMPNKDRVGPTPTG